MHPILAFVLLLPLFLLLSITKRALSKKPNFPPSPPRLPLIGNLHQLGSLPHLSLTSLSKKYGPLMLLRLGEIRTLIVSTPDMAREVMKTHDLSFANRPTSKVTEILLYNNMDVGFSPYGEYWRNVRKLCTIHLLSSKRVQSYHLMREEEVAFMVQKITQCSSLRVIDMSEVLYSFANDTICRVVSGKFSRGGGRNELFREIFEENSYLLSAFNVGDYFPRLAWLGVFFGLSSRARRNFERLDDLLDEVIVEHEDRKKVDEEKDFVDVLLSLQKDSNLDFKLEKDHMKAILADMFGAGTETTSITLEWAMAEIVRNFKVMKKLQDEVRGIVGKNHVVREDDLNSMTYLKAVVKETLRLHPPAPLLIPRESIEDRYIKDYFIPKKTRVIVNGWAINRDPEFWEEPNEFRPERFIDSSVDFKGNDLQFIPFGAGRRICPGIQFAVLNIELALANLIHRFEWELPHGLRREELDMNEKPGLVTRRAEKLHLVAKPCLP
ncbi:cytochrome P450 71A1-like isoform X1 [Ananas comosus]|uniref:Cytochrome P450 71A1-like isoform X1 n=1 Tax=Ananas comosus TaxID=4615 RepID=A0A6P5ELI6_ANACO|nr:cytochrome P450 71A1-like isoform X1 [Ananas comosus]